jgi:cell division protein FtsN
VQGGAFRDRQGAENVLGSVRGMVSNPAGIINEEGFFKVIIGPFSSWKEAETRRISLQRKGFDCFSRKTDSKIF